MHTSQVPAIVPNQNQVQVAPGIQPGSNVIIIPGYAQPPSVYTKYKGRLSMILGVTQIILGIMSIVLTSVSMILPIWLSFVGSGIWCAVLYIIAGAFGIAAKDQGRCLVITHMVLSIIAAVLTAIPFGFSVSGAIIDRSYNYYPGTAVRMTIHILLALVSFTEMVVAVIASVLVCKVTCGVNQQADQLMVGSGGVQYVVATGEGNQLLLQPGPSQPGPSLMMPGQSHGTTSDRPITPPPQYEEKMPFQ